MELAIINNGLILQYGNGGTVAQDSSKTINLNISFSNGLYHANWISSSGQNASGQGTRSAHTKTVSSFVVYNGQDCSMNVCWFAIGN